MVQPEVVRLTVMPGLVVRCTNDQMLTGGAFGFVASRQQLLPVAPAVGASVRFERVLLERITVEADVSGFGRQQSLDLNGTCQADRSCR